MCGGPFRSDLKLINRVFKTSLNHHILAGLQIFQKQWTASQRQSAGLWREENLQQDQLVGNRLRLAQLRPAPSNLQKPSRGPEARARWTAGQVIKLGGWRRRRHSSSKGGEGEGKRTKPSESKNPKISASCLEKKHPKTIFYVFFVLLYREYLQVVLRIVIELLQPYNTLCKLSKTP